MGGTVGDIEGQPFLEAIRQLRTDVGRDSSLYIHVTFLPHIGATGELKTKPTQHSVRELRGIGIQPQVIIARSDHEVSEEICNKIALFCDVDSEAVIPLVTTDNLYKVPLLLEDAGLGDYICKKLNLKSHAPDLNEWRRMINRMQKATKPLRVGIVGKYVELHDAYMSVKEALTHAAILVDRPVDIEWIHSSDLEKGKNFEILETLDGIVVPGGFGERGIEGKILAARFARERDIPYLGLCLGMQVMCIEFARHILDMEDANSTEFEPHSEHPIIHLMPDQRAVHDLGGTMRLGVYPCTLLPETKAANAYQSEQVDERHRHRFEFNNSYRELFEDAGMIFSGLSPNNYLVEIAELKDHPFMLGSQFHPEFQSRPNRPHPLFAAFIEASTTYSVTDKKVDDVQFVQSPQTVSESLNGNQ